jgi:hypothetical protein
MWPHEIQSGCLHVLRMITQAIEGWLIDVFPIQAVFEVVLEFRERRERVFEEHDDRR